MALRSDQRDLISKQREIESGPREKLPIRIGSEVEFVDNNELNGKVRRISKDEWQTIVIDYGSEGKCTIMHAKEFLESYNNGKIKVSKK